MKCFICDDNEVFVDYFKSIFPKNSNVYNLQGSFVNPNACYISVQEEITALNEDAGDEIVKFVFFLDMDYEIENYTGIALGENLLKLSKDVVLVFLTRYDNYMLSSFKVKPYDYLLKPINKEQLEGCLHNVYTLLLRTNQEKRTGIDESKLSFSYGNIIQTVRIKEIVLIKKVNRLLQIECANLNDLQMLRSSYATYGVLEEVHQKLPNSFIRLHKQYIINMNYVKKLDLKQGDCVLYSGEVFKISKDCIKQIKNNYKQKQTNTFENIEVTR
jgi:DNA-binding LytR/AlgR family response regulator